MIPCAYLLLNLTDSTGILPTLPYMSKSIYNCADPSSHLINRPVHNWVHRSHWKTQEHQNWEKIETMEQFNFWQQPYQPFDCLPFSLMEIQNAPTY